MSRRPSVCVALAVKNGAAYLPQAIESVLAQSDVELTLRVIDNRSEDDSVAIASRYLDDPRVSVQVNEEDILYYGSLNRVLSETEADYFVPFACDDAMLPGNLARKVGALEESGAALAHSTALWMDEQGTLSGPVIDHRLTPPLSEAPGFFAQLIPHNRVICPSAVVRTDVLRALDGFDGRDDFAADWLAWLRISLRHPVVTLIEPLVAYRTHGQNGTSRAERLGLRGLYEPATLEWVLGDPAFPPAWRDWHGRLLAMTCAHVAGVLHDSGSRRVVERGWASYMLQTRALALEPHDPEMRARFEWHMQAAGLVAPALPIQAVAAAPENAEEGLELLAATEALGGLLERLLIVVEPERQQAAIQVLEPLFGETELDAVLVPTDQPLMELVPGRLTIARWGAPIIAASEAAGVPVWPYAVPNPFDKPADPERWEVLPGARAAAGAACG
jgi:glycosyltransferase involved in cell wall biosynthesis